MPCCAGASSSCCFISRTPALSLTAISIFTALNRYMPYKNKFRQMLASACVVSLTAMCALLLRTQSLLSSSRSANFDPNDPSRDSSSISPDLVGVIVLTLLCLTLPLGFTLFLYIFFNNAGLQELWEEVKARASKLRLFAPRTKLTPPAPVSLESPRIMRAFPTEASASRTVSPYVPANSQLQLHNPYSVRSPEVHNPYTVRGPEVHNPYTVRGPEVHNPYIVRRPVAHDQMSIAVLKYPSPAAAPHASIEDVASVIGSAARYSSPSLVAPYVARQAASIAVASAAEHSSFRASVSAARSPVVPLISTGEKQKLALA